MAEVRDEDVQRVAVIAEHRWKSMGVASVECECGEICYGPGLTQSPADEAFRRHLAIEILSSLPSGGHPMPDRCGGCQGLGSHRRWCREKVGLQASIYGPMAERLESMGDTVGPNNMGLSNRLWALSADMREWAKSLSSTSAPTTNGDDR